MIEGEKFQPQGAEMNNLVNEARLQELADKVRSLMAREFRTPHDAIPQVLNGNGLKGKTPDEQRKRGAYSRALARLFEEAEA